MREEVVTVPAPPVADPKREVRLGLVLYGGVSLAVYMYGVVVEFWRLVQASRGATANPYTEVLKQANVTATVDVISGTSAGGINGVLLAKALATGADLAVLRNFWIDKADLGLLLRPASDFAPRSLLRSDFFESQLAEAFREMDRRSSGQHLVDVLDLFVSSTRLRGRIREFIDALGQTAQTREYRTMFRLKFRKKGYNPADRELGYDHNDFEPKDNKMLVEISRATSAFPGAFEPKLIVERNDNSVQSASGDLAAYLSDGGILHNKPFTETISTIFARMADRPVRRWLLSVEPDPEYYSSEDGPDREYEVLEVILKAISQIPMYQSIAADLDRLDDHNTKVRSMIQLLGRTERIISERFQAVVNEGTQEEFRRFLEQQVLYHPYLFLKLRSVISDLTNTLVRAASPPEHRKEFEVQREFVEAAVWEVRGKETDPPDKPVNFLETFDDAFRLRRIYYLIEVLEGFIYQPRLAEQLLPDERAKLREAHQTFWAQFARIRELRWDLFEGTGETAKRVKGLYGQLGGALTAATKEVLLDLGVALAGGLAGIRTATLQACEDIEAIIRAIKERRPEGVTYPPHPFPAIFGRYEIRDMFILPVQVLAGFGERDEIGFIRISPAAATYISKAPKSKLAGDTLGHFGGFLSSEWRANDVLWGRLDAAEVISRALLEGQPKDVVERHIHAIQEGITCEELPLVWQRIPNLNYRAYLEQEHTIGDQELADLPAEQRVSLAIRTGQVLRNMLRKLEQSQLPDGVRSAFHYLGKTLGSLLSLIHWPAVAIWGRDIAARKFATLILFFFFGWGVLTLIAKLFNFIQLPPGMLFWVSVVFVVPFLVWVVLLERWMLGVLILLAAAAIAWYRFR